MKRFKYGG